MTQYKDFIFQNVALAGSRRIAIHDANGNRVGQIPLGSLTPPNPATKRYSFGALADVHFQYDTAQADFQRALTYLNEVEDVELICIAGDLTEAGTAEELAQYKQYVNTYSPNTPVYETTGNHEGRNTNLIADFKAQVGRDLYFSFEHKGDVFIFVGCQPVKTEGAWPGSGTLFNTTELQWFYETLEANRNKRCFVFQHVRPQDGCGNTYGIYELDIWGGTEQTVFESLMHHYKNAHHFHGHSHLKFYLQYGSDIANIDHIFGGWSIHIPSLAVPRDGDVSGASSRKEIYSDSEGYVVDVYENGIHLRGRDFIKGEFFPIASYWLDTTLQEIPAGTYTDSTGTITTSGFPNGYTILDYIQFNSDIAFDTDIICNQDCKIEMTFTREDSGARYLFGVASSDNKASFTGYQSGTSSGNWRFGGGYARPSVTTDTKHTLTMDKTGIIMDGTKRSYSGTVGTFTTPQTLVIGGCKSASGKVDSVRHIGKIYSFKMYNGENLVLDYIPCINPSGITGFYDVVGNKFVQPC